MATERRPYHLTADSIWHEPWSNDELAFLTRLSARLHEQWRTNRTEDPDQACRIVLGPTDLLHLSGMRDLRAAWRLLWSIHDLVTLDISCAARASVVRDPCASRARAVRDRCAECASRVHPVQIYWRKWAEFQRIGSGHGGKRGARSSPSASSVQNQRPEPPYSPPAGGTDPVPAKPSPEAIARAAWPALVAAAKSHGGEWRACSPARLRVLAARVREGATEADLIAAVHGAVKLWRSKRGDFDWKRYLTPETIFRPANFTKYAEAGRALNGVYKKVTAGPIVYEPVPVPPERSLEEIADDEVP